MSRQRLPSIVLSVAGFGLALALGCAPSETPEAGSEGERAGRATENPEPITPDALLNPALANETAPDLFKVKLTTTKGDILIEVHRDWSPHGADRFYNLVKIGYYTDVAFYRVLENFMAQCGIHGDPKVSVLWRNANIPDDPVVASNTEGMVTYAKSTLPNSRTTQIFINYKDNSSLDRKGFAPFGQVIEGMEVARSLFGGYGEGAPRGRGPAQRRIQTEGNAYLSAEFPELDYIRSAEIID